MFRIIFNNDCWGFGFIVVAETSIEDTWMDGEGHFLQLDMCTEAHINLLVCLFVFTDCLPYTVNGVDPSYILCMQ